MDKTALKKHRLRVLNQRLALGQVDLRTSLERLVDKVHDIRFEADFMIFKQQCKKVPKSPIRNRYRDVKENNPCLQKIEVESPSSVVETVNNRFFPSSPVKMKASPAPFSPKRKSPTKDKSCPYSPIGMSR